ncbi:MAG: hypothetical protein IT258_16445 [Saprospiraceae bacterium]|nr:hypothetical protein [Saprospiraceae bacterium]
MGHQRIASSMISPASSCTGIKLMRNLAMFWAILCLWSCKPSQTHNTLYPVKKVQFLSIGVEYDVEKNDTNFFISAKAEVDSMGHARLYRYKHWCNYLLSTAEIEAIKYLSNSYKTTKSPIVFPSKKLDNIGCFKDIMPPYWLGIELEDGTSLEFYILLDSDTPPTIRRIFNLFSDVKCTPKGEMGFLFEAPPLKTIINKMPKGAFPPILAPIHFKKPQIKTKQWSE